MNRYREWAPPPDLTRLVECFWTRRDDGTAPAGVVLPDGCIDIIFDVASDGDAAGYVVGTMTRPLAIPSADRDLVAVRFRPGGARLFLDVPAREITDRWLPLGELWSESAQIVDGLVEATSLQARVALVVSALRRSRRHDVRADHVRVSARLLELLSVDEAARQTGLSRQHLGRLYGEHVGIGPKQLSRILRFRNAAAAIRNGEPPSLANVAATFGYSDQAHMNREFREFAGVPPTALRA
jgi:AraC-like DNA-binding protein